MGCSSSSGYESMPSVVTNCKCSEMYNDLKRLYKHEADIINRVLCALVTTIEQQGHLKEALANMPVRESSELTAWWYTHQEFDKQRKEIK